MGEETRCRCDLHHELSPFTAFPQSHGVIGLDKSRKLQTETSISTKPTPGPFIKNDVGDESESSPRPDEITPCEQNCYSLLTWPEKDLLKESAPDTSTKNKGSRPVNRNQGFGRGRDVLEVQTASSIWLFPPRSNSSPNVDATHDERRLFHHFLSYLAKGMIPVRDEQNPFETVYPSLATRSTESIGTRALYHGLLAQSAHHLASLKGVDSGAHERIIAVQHYGIALCLLRRSLSCQSEDYSTVLAAINTILLTEHVFRGASAGWQHHICGAQSFVKRYLSTQPWKTSQEAFSITQNFALSVLISSTVDHTISSTATPDNTGELENLLHDLVSTPIFGYTLGGTTHILAALNRARLLAGRIRARYGVNIPLELDSDTVAEADDILKLCYMSLSDKVNTYVAHRIANGVTVDLQMRTLTELHLRLFNNAIIIYLLCTVLRYPPSFVASEVLQVLDDAAAFIGMHQNTVSIWPVFVAAAEAYTVESQALATHCLESLISSGVANRRKALHVVQGVWSRRSQLVHEGHGEPGDVSVDWSQVMHEMQTYVLLL